MGSAIGIELQGCNGSVTQALDGALGNASSGGGGGGSGGGTAAPSAVTGAIGWMRDSLYIDPLTIVDQGVSFDALP